MQIFTFHLKLIFFHKKNDLVTAKKSSWLVLCYVQKIILLRGAPTILSVGVGTLNMWRKKTRQSIIIRTWINNIIFLSFLYKLGLFKTNFGNLDHSENYILQYVVIIIVNTLKLRSKSEHLIFFKVCATLMLSIHNPK